MLLIFPTYSNNRTLANEFNNYFASIGTKTQSQLRKAKKSLITHFPNHANKFSFNTVSTKDIIRIVSNIPTNKAGGIDSIKTSHRNSCTINCTTDKLILSNS